MKSNSLSKKLKNFSNNKIIFRCDGGQVNEIGTGHIYRCLAIANFLKNKKIKKKNFLFVTKSKKNFKLGYDIIKSFGYNIYSPKNNEGLNDYSEIKTLNNFESELLIIDKIDNLKKNEITHLKKNHKKLVLIDSKSRYLKDVDLNLNPHIKNNYNNKNSGIKYLILPDQKTYHKHNKEKKIFLFFGGYDKKKILEKILHKLDQINCKFKICVHRSHKKKVKNYHNLKFLYFDRKNFFSHLKSSQFSIISGGIILYCSLKLCVPSISIPQYNHQKFNILRISRYGGTIMFNTFSQKYKLNDILTKFGNKNYINKFKKNIKLTFSKYFKKNALIMIFKLYDKKN